MKITIITATLNNEHTIERCLSSVAKQTYKNIEHLIIDGKSTDKTLIIAKNFKHVSKIISEPDSGIYEALNKGIKNATGNVIGFLHADDFFAVPDAVEKIAHSFTKYNTDAVYANLMYVNQKGKIIRHWRAGIFSIHKLKNGWMPPHPTFYVKHELYNRYGLFDTNLKIAADYDMMIRLLWKYKINIKYIDAVLINMQTGGTSNKNIKNIFLKMKEDYKVIKKYSLGNINTLIMKNIRKVNQFV